MLALLVTLFALATNALQSLKLVLHTLLLPITTILITKVEGFLYGASAGLPGADGEDTRGLVCVAGIIIIIIANFFLLFALGVSSEEPKAAAAAAEEDFKPSA